MSDNPSHNKRIAKNTLLLYFRQIVVMIISLYTSRILLATLGVTDYGIYNLVGSFVMMFAFIRSAMGNATNRYIAFAIGKNDHERLKTVFSTCLRVHWILAFLIALLAEAVGIYIFCTDINIPTDRMIPAFIVFQLSVFTCVLGVICVPYDAEIIAHEKMSAFAYMSILDVILKLIVVYLLTISPWDKLVVYAALLAVIQLIDRMIYSLYCRYKFVEVRERRVVDNSLVKEMFGFAVWNLVGNSAAMSCTPIINILLNAFFGPVVNAARGIASQVQSAVKAFVSNFQLAVIPQITKSYAGGDVERMKNLIISSCKYSYFLLLLLSLPVFFEAEILLSLWLVEVPAYSVTFLQLVLVVMSVETLEQPLHAANLATGKIKFFQFMKGFSLFTMLPLAYFALKVGLPAESVLVVQAIVTLFSLLLQIKILGGLIQLPFGWFIREVLGRVIIVTVVAFPAPYIAKCFIENELVNFFLVCILTTICVLVSTFLFGLNRNERKIVRSKVIQMKNKILRNY